MSMFPDFTTAYLDPFFFWTNYCFLLWYQRPYYSKKLF
jgi:hypothetical protein